MLDPIIAKTRVIAITTVAFVAGIGLASGLELTAGTHATPFQITPSAEEVRPVGELSEAFISISEAVTPAVVNIQATRRAAAGQRGQRQPGIPEEFREFFGIPPGGGGGGGGQPQQAGGTGFIVSDDGFIITNNHVIQGAEQITVTLQDRREFAAEVVGRDPSTDIAVIRIDGSGLPTTRIGNSDNTRVGEWVLAIGSPLGLQNTVTAGIISAKDRTINIIGQGLGEQAQWAIEGFLQTDAAINPGNSGGPLVNLRGEVVGVNTAIASQTGRSEGYGFAVPIDLAQRVANDLIAHGRFRRPVLGVQTQSVTSEDAEIYQLPSISGAWVAGFPDDSPAREAGVEIEDVIVGVDGREVSTSSGLQRAIAARDPGETVTLNVIRHGDRRDIRVRLSEIPAETTAPQPRQREDGGGEQLGFQVTELTPEVARQYGYDEPGGVVIAGVQPGSQAQQRNLRQGMRVTHVQRQEIGSVEDFRRAMNRIGAGEVVNLRMVTPDGTTQVANLRMPR